MSIVSQRTKSIENIYLNMPRMLMEETVKERKWIANANRRQLRSGQRADGSRMPDYVPNSRQPMAPGPIQLFDTGLFHEGIEPMFDDKGVELLGLDSKTGLLTGKYGEMILGLTEENISILRDKIRIRINNRIRREIK